MERRTVFKGVLASVLVSAISRPTHAQTSSRLALPEGIGLRPDFSGPLPPGRLGVKRPLNAEEKVAKAIIAATPKGPRPYDVAQFFLSISDGKIDLSWKPFMSGWPDRWNPLIVEFFRATETQPAGDETPWCAAFVNWCYVQAGAAPPTDNASSGSFRCFSSSVETPVAGDIVVFRRTDSSEKCIGKGHVGFYVADRGDKVEVLGGNQIDGKDGSHSVSSKRLPKAGNVLVFHSYRAASAPRQS